MSIVGIGDPHGRFSDLKKLVVAQNGKTCIGLGDVGFGFPGQGTLPTYPNNFYFLRGNHDNPAVCRAHPNYLGDYGSILLDGKKIFYISGAWSIDWKWRREGMSWWRDEELSIAELEEALESYLDFKPDIVLSHDFPNVFARKLLMQHSLTGNSEVIPTRTGQALTAMWDAFEPMYWIGGHYHLDYMEVIGNTTFRCLNELSTFEF